MADGATTDYLRGADRRVTPARADIAAAYLEGGVDSARFVEGRPMQVNAASVPLFPSPDPDVPMDTQLLFGEAFDVYDAQDGWVWGQARRDGYVGYVPEVAFATGIIEPTHAVTVPATSVYRSASIKTMPLDTLSITSEVTVESIEGAFAVLANGCYLPVTHIAPLSEPAQDFVAVAESLLHTPYVWGGKSAASGFDCSALIQLAMARAGVSIPRDSDMQSATVGEEIDRDSALRRGDLLYWKGHCGIMTDAETLLHCTEYTMRTLVEPVAETRARIEGKLGIPLVCLRRPTLQET